MPRRRKFAPRAQQPEPRVQTPMLASTGDFESIREAVDAQPAGSGEPSPVTVSGPTIGVSALGRAWYRFVESTQGRLVRGRAYLRAGAVQDLQVHRGIVHAEVQGTQRYHVKIAVALPGGPQLAELRARLGAALLLRGHALQEPILAPLAALMPAPRHLVPFCQCLDTAPFCKHVCAALYGLGVRLDDEPELLLVLRGLIAEQSPAATRPGLTPLPAEKALTGDLGALFGIDLLSSPTALVAAPEPTPAESSLSAPAEARTFEPDPDQPGGPLDFEPQGPAEIRREYLRELGIPTSTIDAWLREGVLRRTGRHGVYERTPEASRRISGHLTGG